MLMAAIGADAKVPAMSEPMLMRAGYVYVLHPATTATMARAAKP